MLKQCLFKEVRDRDSKKRNNETGAATIKNSHERTINSSTKRGQKNFLKLIPSHFPSPSNPNINKPTPNLPIPNQL